MNILFLNLWGGKLTQPLKEFLLGQSSVDVFCFQESKNIELVLPSFLAEYQSYTTSKHVASKVNFDLAVYAHPRFKVLEVVELFQEDIEIGMAMSIRLVSSSGQTVSIINVLGTPRQRVHGAFLDTDEKRDFPARLRQSERLLQFAQAQTGPVLIGGDFNMLPDTESLDIFRRAGFRDLISEQGITTTRNHYAWDLYPESQRHYYSDYVFVGPEILIRRFEVDQAEVSDHLPMILEVE
jgi:exonuclease III